MNSRSFCILLFLFAFFIVFLPFFFCSGIFPAYRDGEYFYYPLFQFIQMNWRQFGIYPLWNPCEGFGFPMGANATSALLYPPTWLLLLPIPTWLVYNIYIMGHILLAGLTAGFVIRRWRGSWQAACLASVSYALSGTLITLYSNQIYLVSAAWLPLGIWSIYESLCAPTPLRRFKYALICAISIALMTFGGDPQTGYHLGLIGGLLWIIKFFSELWSAITWKQRLWRSFLELKTLILIGLCAGCLAAAVIIPQYKLIQESDRMVKELSPQSQFREESKRYLFSLPPWRANEFLWGNMNGRSYPIFTRWVDMLPIRENDIWVQSLYMGAFPFLLAVCSLRFFRGPLKRRWLSWILLLSLFAAWGGYGPGAALKELGDYFGWGWLTKINPQEGGLYWILEQICPGYASFRYPGKWLPVTAVAISLLAGLYWDKVWNCVRVRGKSLTILAVSFFVLSFLSFLLPVGILRFIRYCLADETFRKGFIFETYGPFCGYNPAWSFLSGLGFLCFALLIMTYLRKAGYWSNFKFSSVEEYYSNSDEDFDEESAENSKESENETEANAKANAEANAEANDENDAENDDENMDESKRLSDENSSKSSEPVRVRWIPALVLILFALELALFNHGLILIVPDKACVPVYYQPGMPQRLLAEDYWIPSAFNNSVSRQRQAETANWNSQILLFNHAFPNNVSQLGYNGTLRLLDYSVSDEVANRHNVQIEIPFVEYEGRRKTFLTPGKMPKKVKNPLPRVFMVRNVEWITPEPGEKKAKFFERSMEKLLQNDKLMDLRRFAIAVGKKPSVVFDSKTDFQDKITVTDYGCHRAVIEAEVKAPGLLLFLDQYWDEWSLNIEEIGVPGVRSGEIVRTDNMFRGTVIDKPGKYKLTYTYTPRRMYAGIAVSLLGWLFVAAALIFVGRKRRSEVGT